ncbi:MAG: hypothetical protein ABH891_05560 [Candidatus Omnitrophota bacterium]
MMKRALAVFLIPIVLISFSGCMTIANGGKEQISFDSAPTGAKIFSAGGVGLGETPTAAILKRKRDEYITFKKEGYEDKTMLVANELSPWFWLFGSIIDLITGAAYRFENEHYYAELKPVKT